MTRSITEGPRRCGKSIDELARAIHVPVNRLSRLIRRERGMTNDTALRLAAFWGTSARYWMNLQTLFELDLATAGRVS